MAKLREFGVWILVAVLSVGMLTLYVDNGHQRDCMAKYMASDQENTIARSTVADQERTVFLATLREINDPKSTVATRTKALNDYISLVEENNKIRKENPPLPVPTECD